MRRNPRKVSPLFRKSRIIHQPNKRCGDRHDLNRAYRRIRIPPLNRYLFVDVLVPVIDTAADLAVDVVAEIDDAVVADDLPTYADHLILVLLRVLALAIFIAGIVALVAIDDQALVIVTNLFVQVVPVARHDDAVVVIARKVAVERRVRIGNQVVEVVLVDEVHDGRSTGRSIDELLIVVLTDARDARLPQLWARVDEHLVASPLDVAACVEEVEYLRVVPVGTDPIEIVHRLRRRRRAVASD